MKFLIVVDMQADFITGSLGSEQAAAIVPNVVEKIKQFDGRIIFTRDTHFGDYMETQEGRKLPVPHCIKDSDGWQICDEIRQLTETLPSNHISYIDKPTFGCVKLPEMIANFGETIDSITLCGLCTDICVISNVLLTKAFLPNTRIIVDASCCAGSTLEKHLAALEVMKSCHIDVIH